jgi:hypothetical protein
MFFIFVYLNLINLSIMALNYTYIKYKDVHTLKNNESINMNYEILKDSCDVSTSISTGVIAPGNTITINFATDGNYTINLSTINDTDSFNIKYFQNLLKSFITDAEKVLCGCTPCKDCEECNECQDYLSAFMKAFSINTINFPSYQDYFEAIAQNNVCDFTNEVLCIILNEKVFGSASVKELMLKILSYYYLAFYFRDYSLALDSEEQNYITVKYKFDKISKCIKKLGITPSNIF